MGTHQDKTWVNVEESESPPTEAWLLQIMDHLGHFSQNGPLTVRKLSKPYQAEASSLRESVCNTCTCLQVACPTEALRQQLESEVWEKVQASPHMQYNHYPHAYEGESQETFTKVHGSQCRQVWETTLFPRIFWWSVKNTERCKETVII